MMMMALRGEGFRKCVVLKSEDGEKRCEKKLMEVKRKER